MSQKIISPIAEIDNLKSKDILTENFTSTNATVSGTLIAQNIQTSQVNTDNLETNDATITGTLYAENIISRQGSIGDLMTAKISSLRDEIKNIIAARTATESAILADSHNWSTEVATDSAKIEGDLALSNNLIVGSNLLVHGDTQLGNAFITGTFTAGEIAIKDNFIETAASALYIQPSSTGSVHIMGDSLVIADTGDVAINKNVTIHGSLFGNLLTANEIRTQKLIAQDLTSDRINIATDSASTIIASDTDIDFTSNTTELNSNATAGTATLPAFKTELIIHTNKLTSASMVYLTPVGSTQNKVLYIKDKVIDISEPYFTISLDQPLDQDIQVNWWIIN